MSKFLAPIHFKQYDKIKNQNMIIEEILDLNEEQSWIEDLREEANGKIGKLDKKPLEEIIDETDIHGWLSEKIDLVEKKLAYVVSKIVNEDEDRKSIILKRIMDLSLNMDEEKLDLKEAYGLINDSFLDGMPCDRITEVVQVTEDSVTWKRNGDIHSPYWEYGVDGEFYYQIRDAFIGALVEKQDIKYEILENNMYRLKV